MDQHAFNWCGACYVVAVVQMLQDRWNLATGRNVTLSVQRVLDEFDGMRRSREPASWNACHGGAPTDVVECLRRGACHLVPEAPDTGFVGRVRRWVNYGVAGRAAPRSVGESRVVAHGDVRAELMARGTVGLLVSAEVLARTDRDGVVPPSLPLVADHVVGVVGWMDDHWIVRNSWGASSRPTAVPDDFETCNTIRANTCRTDRTPWHSMPSMPGHCLLPTSYTQETPGVFFVADVV